MAYSIGVDNGQRTERGIRFTIKGNEILSMSRLEVECLWLETQTESELADSLQFHQQMVLALQAELAVRRAGAK